jgi:repressor LexA
MIPTVPSKRYYPEGDRVRFQPANKTMQPISVKNSDFGSTMLLGQVVGVYPQMSFERR